MVGTDNVYTDPLYDAMAWMYRLINVESVWRQGITGKDVLVRINDVGVDATHPDLALNFDVNNSCSDYLPSSPDTDVHGTATASILAAGANNGACSVGIAPEAILVSTIVLFFFLKASYVMVQGESAHLSLNNCNFNYYRRHVYWEIKKIK